MTQRTGNKNIGQHRGKQARKEIKASNVALEAVKKAAARAKYRNVQKGEIKGSSLTTA